MRIPPRTRLFALLAVLGFALAGCGGDEPAGPVNHAPVADAGSDRAAVVGLPVTLDGSGSHDPDGDPLAYLWSFVSRPVGSAALLEPDTTAATAFTPDVAGDYQVRLMVFDSRVGGDDEVSIQGSHVNGFLLFDVSSIPDGVSVVGMTMKCYLEDAFESPFGDPVVDVYYSGDDGWTRGSVTRTDLSLDTPLVETVSFTTYVPSYEFTLDVAAHDWTADLADDRICFGFDVPEGHSGYVYFYGAYGDPPGPPPELTIRTVARRPQGSR